jgi:tripartite-type tricarboxylate transporter receptor subunit TctC
MTTRRRFLNLAAAALATPALPRLASAQTWPARPIRAMIPFSAGSSLDIVGRIVLDPLSSQLGQTIVVENRGGAGGTIGTAAVAKAEADGYTILINASAHSAAPAAYPNIAYDPARDFSAVIPFGTVPNVTLVAPAKGIKTIQELVTVAKSGSLSYASAGVGSATHWAAERLRVSAGFQAVHVPFRGGPEALTEVMTGRVDFTCMGMSASLPFIRDGKLVPLAVSSAKRSSALPAIPTTLESGLADSDYNYWMGMFVPAKTPLARSSIGCTRRRRRRCACPLWWRNSARRGSSRCR